MERTPIIIIRGLSLLVRNLLQVVRHIIYGLVKYVA